MSVNKVKPLGYYIKDSEHSKPPGTFFADKMKSHWPCYQSPEFIEAHKKKEERRRRR